MASIKMQPVVITVIAAFSNDQYLANLPRAAWRKSRFYISSIGSHLYKLK